MRKILAIGVSVFALCAPAAAQKHGAHPHHHDQESAVAPSTMQPPPPAPPEHDHGAHDHGVQDHFAPSALYGPYPMSREASGTAWIPDATPMDGAHIMGGGWSGMIHGNLDVVHSDQGGSRGDEKTFSASMLMGMARRELGPGVLGLRGMISLDPLMGKRGYPLLLQTGETANGEPLIDRQHPHDFLGELAASYSLPLGPKSAVFGYVGYPGEPALGPPAYLHRFSGMMSPEAPLGHHWLDSTHITFGVVTAGVVADGWKLEASSFTGREPDEDRWDFDDPKFDSASVRLSWNPSPAWALQVSRGDLNSPESHEPDVDITRSTASAIWQKTLGPAQIGATLAWGRNEKDPGETTDTWLLESAARLYDRHIVFARAERSEKDELFNDHDDEEPLADKTFDVGKLSVGYAYEIPVARTVRLSFGGLVSVYDLPDALTPVYGDDPTSHMLFTRLRIAQ